MQKSSFTLEQFNEYKGYAKSNDPQVFTTTLAGLRLDSDSYEKNYILVALPTGGEHRMSVSTDFFKQLAKMLRINLGLKNTIEKDVYSRLLDTLKSLQSVTKEIVLVFDPTQGKITHISDKGYNRISNIQLFDFAEGLLNKYPQLEIESISGGNGFSSTEIKILSSNIVQFDDVTSNDDESFNFGLTLKNSGVSTTVNDFAYRLICANGMMGIRTDERFRLQDTTQAGLFQLFEHFEKMEKTNFIPEDFADNIANASNTMASLEELESAISHISSKIVGEFPEQTEQLVAGMVSRFFPELDATYQRLKIKGIDPKTLTNKQKRFVNTNKSMWELVNVLTDLGSNKHLYTIQNKQTLQNIGAKFLTKEHDLINLHLLKL